MKSLKCDPSQIDVLACYSLNIFVKGKTKMLKLSPPIGILGGTFDPIHLGHLHLGKTVLQMAKLEYLKLIPCYQSPLRIPPIASPEHRCAMIQLAIEKEPNFKLDEREITRKHISYTIDAIKSLRQELGVKVPLCLIMGSDAFMKFTSWHKWQSIIKLAHLIVATRPAVDADEHTLLTAMDNFPLPRILKPEEMCTAAGGFLWYAAIEPLAISASAIREKIKHGESAARLLPTKVWQYIEAHNLYK